MPQSITTEHMIHLLKRITSATVHIAADGRVSDLGGWAELTGLSAEETMGTGWLAVVHADDQERVVRAWDTAKDHGTDYNTEFRVRVRDGSYRWFNARAVPNYDADGNLNGWVGLMLPLAGGLRHAAEDRADQAVQIRPAALRAARAMLDWSASDLAEAAGISRSTVRRLESDEDSASVHRNTSLAVINALSNAGLKLLVTGQVVDGVRAAPAAAEDDNVISFPQAAIEG